MGLFGSGKDPGRDSRDRPRRPARKSREEAAEDALRREEIDRIVEEYRQSHSIRLPRREGFPGVSSREYRLYRTAEKRRKGWYERLCGISGRIISLTPDSKTREDLEGAIALTGMDITPGAVMGLLVLSIMLSVILGVMLAMTGAVPLMAGFLIAAAGLPLGYYFLKYPSGMVKQYRMQASSQVVLAVLYMVVSMRISPNLERALRFAAANVSGPLAWDMRRLLWAIEMREYSSASDALSDYIAKWKGENEEFSEALHLIRDSETQTVDKGREILDQALTTILDGTKTRMKHYAQDLTTPVMVIHMMGIVLPVLGTIMAPLAAVFLADLVGPVHFIVGYDIALPLVIIWFINTTLKKRPVTFSQVDISSHPDVPPKGTFTVGRRHVPALPVAAALLLAFTGYPVYYFIQHPDLLFAGLAGHTIESLTMSCLITLGVAVSISSYLILSSMQACRVQARVQTIEGEFELALFQLGNRIAGGTPTEVAIEKSVDDMKDLEIAGLFRQSLRNIRNLGMTFEDSLFHPKYGSLRYYPSHLIRNIMYTVIDTGKRGVTYASEAMIRISHYLKSIRETQEYIRDLLAETASSMRFQAYMLTPLITGLIVSMADIIIQVLVKIGQYLQGVQGGTEFTGISIANAFGNVEKAVSPSLFQLIVGVYVIEVIAILAIFLTKISQGENRMLERYNIGRMLLVGMTLYFIVALASSSLFGDLIRDALSGMGI
jgi:hypothetical protein